MRPTSFSDTVPFNAPALPPVKQDRALVRRYLWQSALRYGGGTFATFALLIVFPLTLAILLGGTGHFQHGGFIVRLLGAWLTPSLLLALAATSLARLHLERLREQRVVLTGEMIAARVRRELASPLDRFTSFDLSADVLSGLTLGEALGYGRPAAFVHDPFAGRIVIGPWRPLWLCGGIEVQVAPDPGAACRVTVRGRFGIGFFNVQKGEALRAVETVCAALRQQFQRRVDEAEAIRRERELERTSLQARLSALQAQVEPHFLFNTLANLKYLIRTDERSAQLMLDHLVGYLQNAVPNMRSVSSTLGRELELARDYLSIMRIRMGERLSFRIEADETLLAQPFPPAMLISLVENAVKHGLEKASRDGEIAIAAGVAGRDLRVTVTDNGVGLLETAGQGTGLSNIHERLALLYGERASLQVSPGPGAGVVATLTLPLTVSTTEEPEWRAR